MMACRHRISKRRWKARIGMGKWIPEQVFATWPDLARRMIVIRRNDYTFCSVVALRSV